ncbi:hypothetical protein C8R44DRAFT_253144 [Mycena epipterygia]|nr:hypothetical protein C8R44DRAFT_253144 [Mycena epipterygia]
MFRSTDSPAFGESRRDSSASHAMSTISQTPSTRPILAPTPRHNLEPPTAPFRATSPTGSTHSLTVNYLPSKFSNSLLARRRGGKGDAVSGMMPRGGGVEAFRSGATRIPGAGDEDYDGVDVRRGGIFGFFTGAGGRGGRGLRWTRFKVILFIANTVLVTYALTALIFVLLVYFRTLDKAPILLVANTTELGFSAAAATVALLTSLIGFPGILLNNRPFLATYTFMLWVCFGLLVVPGYITYKRRSLNLEGKVNQQWSQELGAQGRLTVQNILGCCGYFNPFVEATVSSTCYSRSVLPGCKKAFLDFERDALERWYTISFALVPVNIAVIVAGLLCSNHVTYRFGKGMMPKAYRLSKESMAVIMEKYAAQLAEQYGSDAAAQILASASSSRTNSPGGGNG